MLGTSTQFAVPRSRSSPSDRARIASRPHRPGINPGRPCRRPWRGSPHRAVLGGGRPWNPRDCGSDYAIGCNGTRTAAAPRVGLSPPTARKATPWKSHASLICFPVSAASRLGLNERVSAPSASSNKTNFAKPFWRSIGRRFHAMKMSSLPNLQTEKQTSSSEASPVRMYLAPESAPALPESVQDSTGRWFEPFAWLDRDTQSWRTWQSCLVMGWTLFSETWPRSGMTRSGIAFRPVILGRRMAATGFGSSLPTPTNGSGRQGGIRALDGGSASRKKLERLATPTVHGNYNRQGCSATSGDELLTQMVRELGGPVTGKPSLRRFVEWMMGYSQDWTEAPTPPQSGL